ncbi:hypothetical protein AGLY_014059, partial [Aphis glycines]
SKNERKVPPIIIKRTNKTEDNVDLDRHTTHNSDDEFRSPRRTSKIYDSPTKKSFTTPNRYSLLDNTNTNDQEINEFTSTSKYDKIKINLETVDDFRTLTKYLDEKKLKTEKDISAIIRNHPMSITEFEVMEELKILEYPVKSVTRLTNKIKIPTPLMAVQLINHHKSQEIFKLSKLLNCIEITEPHPPQCTNYQRCGHLHKTCKLQPRCVKCNLSHHYSNCDKTSEIPPNCVNCNEAHPTNYKGCTYFKNIKNKKTNIKKAFITKDEPPKDKSNSLNGIPMVLNPKNLHLLNFYNIDIACVTETHLKNTETFKINGYKIYRKDRDTIHSSRGVAILVKRIIKHQLNHP